MTIYYILLLTIVVFNALGLYEIAKRRGLKNPWFAFVPLGQQYLQGEILDSISAYRGLKTSYRFIIVGIITISFILVGFSAVSGLASTILLICFNIYSFFTKDIYFFIYKDYFPKHAIACVIVSLFIYCEFIIVFAIRKNVPVSMCFKREDEWQYETNKPTLQMLWNEYHSTPQIQSWTEFLTANFTPTR